MHGKKGNDGVLSSLGCATLMVTTALAIPAGLVAQWSEEDQKDQQAISIPLETYAQGCVKDVEEGLEVKLPFPFRQRHKAVPAAVCPSAWMSLGKILLRDARSCVGWGPNHCSHLSP